MARRPTLAGAECERLARQVEARGYDASKLPNVPQHS